MGQLPIVVINGRSIPGSCLFSRRVMIAWLPFESGGGGFISFCGGAGRERNVGARREIGRGIDIFL